MIIDPVLTYSTYLGGSGSDVAYAIAIDSAGSAYVTGATGSPDFPTVNPFQAGLNSLVAFVTDVFVAKLNPNGTGLVYSTYLGGSDLNLGQAIAVDSAGSAYVTGFTTSKDFRTVKPVQPSLNAGYDVFVAKLDPTGSSLVYSTFLGGSGDDLGFGIAVDSSSNAYVTGVTGSPDFPTTAGSFQPQTADNTCQLNTEFCGDAFVTKLNAAGSAFVYSTRLGGSLTSQGQAIAVDAEGEAYVTGLTQALDFPVTAGAFQTGSGGLFTSFVAKVNASGSSLIYSTYLGGSAGENAFGIAVDSSGSAYVIGSTSSADFPTANAFQSTLGGNEDAFVAKLQPPGCGLAYSTYLGGSDGDQGYAIAIDPTGNAYVTGWTGSVDFPTVNAIQANNRSNGSGNIFLTALSAAGSALVYSTYLGGNNIPSIVGEQGNAVAVDAPGNVYLAGATDSTNFPTVNPLQPTYGGSSDAFVAKITHGVIPPTASLSPAKSITFLP